MARLGLAAELLRAENSRLIYCAISGFGQTGPWAARPAYDQIIQGVSGVMSITGDAASGRGCAETLAPRAACDVMVS
jgi:formyl-CoA transferase